MTGQLVLGRRRMLAAFFSCLVQAASAEAGDTGAVLEALSAAAHARLDAPDGRWVALAHGEVLTLFDRTGRDSLTLPGTDRAGRLHARCTQLLALPGRRSIIAVWPGLGELWELSLDPAATPVFDGLVHDYRLGEGIAASGYRHPRRTVLGAPGAPVPWFHAVAPGVAWLAGTLGDRLQVWHLDVRRRIADWALPGARPADSWLTPVASGGPPDWWVPVGDGQVVIDTGRWVLRDPDAGLGRAPQR
jgi:hypothetical protein